MAVPRHLSAQERAATADAARLESLAAAVQAHAVLGRHDPVGAMVVAYRALPEFRGDAWPDVPEVRQVLLSAYAASHLVAAYDRKATAASLSRDGKRIALALKDSVEVHSLDSGVPLIVLKLPARPAAADGADRPIAFVDIAADGRHLLAAGAHDYWVWPLDGSDAVHSGSCGDFPEVDAARFVGSGAHVLVKCGFDLKILDVGDLHEIGALHDVTTFDTSRDGRLIATDKDVRAIADGTVVLTLPQSDDASAAVAFAPDGQSLAVGRSRTVAIWNVADAAATAPPATIDVQSAVGISAITYSPDGKWLVTASSGEIRVWDAASGDLVRVWSDHRTNQSAEVLNPDRLYVSGDGRWLLTASSWQDGMYTTRSTLWSLAHPEAPPIRITRGEAERLAAAFTQGAAPIFATIDKTSPGGRVFVWSADSPLVLHRWGNDVLGSFALLAAAAGSNDIILKNVDDGSLRRCGVDTPTCTPASPATLAALDTVIVTPQGKAMVTLQRQELVATSLEDGSIVWRRALAGAGSTGDFTVLDGGAYVLWTAGLGRLQPTIMVLRAADGQTARTFDNASSATPLSGRHVVTVMRPKGFALVDIDTGKSIALDLPGDSIAAVAVTRDGARAAIVTSREDATSGAPTVQFLTVIATADGHADYSGRIDQADWHAVQTVAFSPDGGAILLGDLIIDATSGKRMMTLAADTEVPVYASRYSPDGRLIFALYDAGLAHTTTLRIFSAADGMLLQTFLTAPALTLQFSRNGKAFVMEDYDGLGVHLVPTPDAIAARARRLLESAGLLKPR